MAFADKELLQVREALNKPIQGPTVSFVVKNMYYLIKKTLLENTYKWCKRSLLNKR